LGYIDIFFSDLMTDEGF